MLKHEFTTKIFKILSDHYGENPEQLLESFELLKYLNIKTRSATIGSKSRSSFANHYALYVLIEDYVKKGFETKNDYASYEGAKYSDLFTRMRELPFGSKLQNHALNHRLNQEFKKYFQDFDGVLVIRDPSTNRYWINENLLIKNVGSKKINIAAVILEIINEYVTKKRESLERFIEDCKRIQALEKSGFENKEVRKFITELLKLNVDARIFEIVSFAILKEYYSDQSIYWGWDKESIQEDKLALYKTGRTNANDGGIDFVMRPLGRFFQVTETLDAKKYFLDIDKIERYPITFVIKSQEEVSKITQLLEKQARDLFPVEVVVQKYMSCIEEVVNLSKLVEWLDTVIAKGSVAQLVDTLVKYSQLEFNYEEN